jgi:ubiquinone biosynthesis protein UbiJ
VADDAKTAEVVFLCARVNALTRRVESLEHRLRDHGWRLRDVVILLERAGDTEVAGYLSELVQRLEKETDMP